MNRCKMMKRMKDDSDEDERRRGGTAKAKIRRRGDLRLAIATTKISSKHIHETRRQACGLYPQTIGIVLRVAPSYCR